MGTPGFGERLNVRLAGDAKVAFIKWFYFLAVFKEVFNITYLIKQTPLRKFRYNHTSHGWHLGESKDCIPNE